eukprot:30850-Pelagococcus_subviridis.AAC.23
MRREIYVRQRASLARDARPRLTRLVVLVLVLALALGVVVSRARARERAQPLARELQRERVRHDAQGREPHEPSRDGRRQRDAHGRQQRPGRDRDPHQLDGVAHLRGVVPEEHDARDLGRGADAAAHGDPDVRHRERGGVVDPVADHRHLSPSARRALQPLDQRRLPLRSNVAVDVLGRDPDRRPDALRGLLSIPGQQQRAHPALLQPRDRALRVRANLILHLHDAHHRAVDGDEHGRPSGGHRVHRALDVRGERRGRRRGERARADGDRLPVHDRGRAGTRGLLERALLRLASSSSPLCAAVVVRVRGGVRGDDRERERVPAVLLDGRGEREDVVLAEVAPLRRDHALHDRPAQRQRARLIEHDGVHLVRALQHVATAYQQPVPRAQRRPHEHRGRRREPERAGARDDEHARGELQTEKQRTVRAGDNRGGERRGEQLRAHRGPKRERRRARAHDAVHELPGDFVREPLHGGLALLRRLDHPHDARDGRLLAAVDHLDDDGAVQVHRPGRDVVSGAFRARYRLAVDRGLVHLTRALDDDAVHGDAIAGQDDDVVARLDHRRRDGSVILAAAAAAAAAATERAHVARRPQLRALLDRSPQQHEREQHHGLLEKRRPPQPRKQHRGGGHPERRERAQRDERVHVRPARAQGPPPVRQRLSSRAEEREHGQPGVHRRGAKHPQPRRGRVKHVARVTNQARARERPRDDDSLRALLDPSKPFLALGRRGGGGGDAAHGDAARLSNGRREPFRGDELRERVAYFPHRAHDFVFENGPGRAVAIIPHVHAHAHERGLVREVHARGSHVSVLFEYPSNVRRAPAAVHPPHVEHDDLFQETRRGRARLLERRRPGRVDARGRSLAAAAAAAAAAAEPSAVPAAAAAAAAVRDVRGRRDARDRCGGDERLPRVLPRRPRRGFAAALSQLRGSRPEPVRERLALRASSARRARRAAVVTTARASRRQRRGDPRGREPARREREPAAGRRGRRETDARVSLRPAAGPRALAPESDRDGGRSAAAR